MLNYCLNYIYQTSKEKLNLKRNRAERVFSLLNQLSGYLFSLGLVANMLGHLLFKPLYLAGNIIWYIALLFSKKQEPRKDRWFGFASFKEQFQMASVIGTIATIISISIPALLVPAAWLFFASNIIWSIGEHHRKSKPPNDDESYSSSKQDVYCLYTKIATCVSGITALSASIVLLFPPIAATVIMASSIIGITLTILAMATLFKSITGDYPPDSELTNKDSYQNIYSQLSLNNRTFERNPPAEPIHNIQKLCWSSKPSANSIYFSTSNKDTPVKYNFSPR